MRFRPVKESDLDDLMTLASRAGIGLTTLPHDFVLIQQKIEKSLHAFQKAVSSPEDEMYLFVLEDSQTQKVVGTAAIEASIGHHSPFYALKRLPYHTHCESLNINQNYHCLSLCDALKSYSELCTLFLDPNYRQGINGLFLSRARFLFMAIAPERFHTHLLAEIRGVSDAKGQSPFWQHVIQPFFNMSYEKADRLSISTDKQFIRDLMPSTPFLEPIMARDAQQVIGQPHENSKGALNILLNEGFELMPYVHPFDAGPLIQGEISALQTVSSTRPFNVKIQTPIQPQLHFLVHPHYEFEVHIEKIQLVPELNCCLIPKEIAKKLRLEEGQKIYVSPFYHSLNSQTN